MSKANSLFLIVLLAFVNYIFFLLFNSSINKEKVMAMADFNSEFVDESGFEYLEGTSGFDGESLVILYGAELEVILRRALLEKQNTFKGLQVKNLYHKLLQNKPSSPYLYSGLIQSEKEINEAYYINAVKYGPFERSVAYSVAEVLFFKWDNFGDNLKSHLLQYLISQRDLIKGNIASIALKFARMYEFCDSVYEESGVKLYECKKNYWQPLLR